MARIKKRKLAWAASTSPQVIGYKLYWAENQTVGYHSHCVTLGNVTEVVLPDDVEGFSPSGGAVEFGITAMDELGNESDLITFSAAHQFNVPQAPEDLWMETMDDFHAADAESDGESTDDDDSEPIILFDKVTSEVEFVESSMEAGAGEAMAETSQSPRIVQHYGHPEHN